MGGWNEFWRSLFRYAKRLGLKPKNLILIILAAFAFAAMAIGTFSPVWAILAVVIFYCLDPAIKMVKSQVERRNKLSQRAIIATEFERYLEEKRRELTAAEPELPLPPHNKREPT